MCDWKSFVSSLLATIVAAAALVCFGGAATANTITTYAGNGNSSFGGAVGNGSLEIFNNAAGDLNFTYTRGSSPFNNAVVIYIDSQPGGAGSTAGFTDNADGLRRAISGFDAAQGRSTLNFAAGFGADYAIALNEFFAGFWSLSDPTNFPFVTAANLTPTGNQTAASYTFGITAANIGLTADSGQTFSFFTSYTSETAFRSGETFGASYVGSPASGWNTFDAAASNTFTLVPEPSTFGMAAVAIVSGGFMVRRRRRRA